MFSVCVSKEAKKTLSVDKKTPDFFQIKRKKSLSHLELRIRMTIFMAFYYQNEISSFTSFFFISLLSINYH